MESSLEAGPPIEVVTSRQSSGAAASAYPAKEVMMSRRRRELGLPLFGSAAGGATAIMSSKSGFTAGLIIGMIAAVLCLYQCYRVLKAREAPPAPPSTPRLRRCYRMIKLVWQLALVIVASWSAVIGAVRVASYFEANLLERGVCNWGCVRVSLFHSEHCDDFCSPLLLRSNQAAVHEVVRRWLQEQPSVASVRTVEKDSSPKKASSSATSAVSDGSATDASAGVVADGTGTGSAAAAGPTVYTYGVSLSTLVGFPSELGVETSCMPLPTGAGNSTGVLVSVQAQQLFRVGFPDIQGEKSKVKALLMVLREAADKGELPEVPCS